MYPRSHFLGSGISKIKAFFCHGSTAGKTFWRKFRYKGDICQNHPCGSHPFAKPRYKFFTGSFSKFFTANVKNKFTTSFAIQESAGIAALTAFPKTRLVTCCIEVIMHWITQLFWNVDILMSFRMGYVMHDEVITEQVPVASHS